MLSLTSGIYKYNLTGTENKMVYAHNNFIAYEHFFQYISAIDCPS